MIDYIMITKNRKKLKNTMVQQDSIPGLSGISYITGLYMISKIKIITVNSHV